MNEIIEIIAQKLKHLSIALGYLEENEIYDVLRTETQIVFLLSIQILNFGHPVDF